tara:strand:- start:11822 stop:12154 length:333 start_codon:yes stop_codon:yes gene_type:complete
MSINDATPEEWDNVNKNKLGKAYAEIIKLADGGGHDPVNKPIHYNNGDIEAIDYIKQQLGHEFQAYCYGSVIKYMHRFKYKDGLQDLKKAKWYLKQMISDMEQQENEEDD